MSSPPRPPFTQVIGNDAAVAFGGAAGNFELNVMMPVIARTCWLGCLLTTVLPLLADRCVAGITAHPDRMRPWSTSSPVIVTALNRYIGYEAAAEVAHEALARGESIAATVVITSGCLERGEITSEQLDAPRRARDGRVQEPGPGGGIAIQPRFINA